MRIESKATGKAQQIKKEQWDKMGYRKNLYNIIDSSDSIIPSVVVEEIKFEKISPQEVFEEDSLQEGIDQLCKDNTKAELKQLLDENDIKYENENKQQLAEIYLRKFI